MSTPADRSATTKEVMEEAQANTTEDSSISLLLGLPPELLLPIFSFVGAENFRWDLGRLAVCKKWYAFARPILLGELQLHSYDLLPMLRATRRGARLAAAQQMTKNVELSIIRKHPSAFHLERLASRLTVFAALRTLVIRSNFGLLSLISNSTMPRLRSRVISSFVAIQQLTSVEIDIQNLQLERDGVHLCESISRRIPTLKRLRCRLPHICNVLLESPTGDLEELIICISGALNPTSSTRQCFTDVTLESYQHQAALEAQLVQFAASMRNPKIVRLIYGYFPAISAFDAVRKRRLLLGSRPAWDADGELLPEDLEDSEESGEDEDSDDYEGWDSEIDLLDDSFDDDA